MLVLYSLVCEWLPVSMGHCVFLSLLLCLFLALQKVSGRFTLLYFKPDNHIPLSESESLMCLTALKFANKTCYSLGSK